jgi:hypothetical protein
MTENSLNILSDIAYKNKHYLNNELDPNCKRTIETVWNDINTLKENVPGVIEGFGLGFPFHSLNRKGELIVNPEFSEYSNNFIDKISISKSLGQEAWKCFQCQNSSEYDPALCKTCQETIIKPRDVMRVMPDIDIFLITEDTSPATLDEIQAVANEQSFHQSDKNAYETLQRIDASFGNIKKGEDNVYFPCDMHAISRTDFINSMSSLSFGNLDISPDIHSLHYGWVVNKKLDFTFDIIFSSTFNDKTCDPEILEIVKRTQYEIADNHSNSDILDIVKKRSKRAGILLSYEPTKQAFIDKIESWRNNDRPTYPY